VECAKGVFEVQSNFAYLNFLLDITPHCDCHPYSDIPVVPDLGIMASKDVVAIDRASVDLYREAENLSGALLNHRKFWDWTDVEGMLDYAEEFGLGTRNYRLIDVS